MIAHEQTTSWCRTVGPQMNAENAKGETTIGLTIARGHSRDEGFE